MHHEIATWFLVISLIFPRITLLIAWLNGSIPYNTIPFILDAVMAVFLPRVLILIYIGTNMGCDNAWFIIHAIVGALVWIGSAVSQRR
jgi:Na+/alanine symporter